MIKRIPDSIWFGLVIGIVLPVLFGLLFIQLTNGADTISYTLHSLVHSPTWAVRYLFMAMLPDFFGVYFLNRWEKWQSCRGMILAMMQMVIGILILSF